MVNVTPTVTCSENNELLTENIKMMLKVGAVTEGVTEKQFLANAIVSRISYLADNLYSKKV